MHKWYSDLCKKYIASLPCSRNHISFAAREEERSHEAKLTFSLQHEESIPSSWFNNIFFITIQHVCAMWPKSHFVCNTRARFLPYGQDEAYLTGWGEHFCHVTKETSHFNYLTAFWPPDTHNTASALAKNQFAHLAKDSTTFPVTWKILCRIEKLMCVCNRQVTWHNVTKKARYFHPITTSAKLKWKWKHWLFHVVINRIIRRRQYDASAVAKHANLRYAQRFHKRFNKQIYVVWDKILAANKELKFSWNGVCVYNLNLGVLPTPSWDMSQSRCAQTSERHFLPNRPKFDARFSRVRVSLIILITLYIGGIVIKVKCAI